MMMDVCVFRFCDVTAAERLRSGWTRGGIHTNRASGYAGRDTDRYTHTHTHQHPHTHTTTQTPHNTHTHTHTHAHYTHEAPVFTLYTQTQRSVRAHTHANMQTHVHSPTDCTELYEDAPPPPLVASLTTHVPPALSTPL